MKNALYELDECDIGPLADDVRSVRKINIATGLPEFCFQAHVPKYGWADIVEGIVGLDNEASAEQHLAKLRAEIAAHKDKARH